MAHPAGTFICIYSSWLTCHSPSSNVSIQGTIIYRIIDSRAPHRLSCQVTSPPLLVTSRDESRLPGCPFLQIQSEGGGSLPVHLSSLLLVLSAPWLTCCTSDRLSDLYRQCQCPPHYCKPMPRLRECLLLAFVLSFHVLLASWSQVSKWPIVCRHPMEHMA